MSCSPAHIRYEKQKEAFLKGDMTTVRQIAKEARADLERRGYVSAYPLFRWIKKEWFDKAIAEGVIRFNSKEYGYQIVAIECEVKEVIGHRGREPIYEKKIKLDISKWQDFSKRYKEFREQKEGQQYAIDQDFIRLIKTEQPLLPVKINGGEV